MWRGHEMEAAIEAPGPDDRVLISLVEVDCANCDELEAQIRRVADSADRRVVVDLSAVTFLDSSGMRVLVVVDRELRARGGELVLANLTRAVRSALGAGGVLDHFEVESDA